MDVFRFSGAVFTAVDRCLFGNTQDDFHDSLRRSGLKEPRTEWNQAVAATAATAATAAAVAASLRPLLTCLAAAIRFPTPFLFSPLHLR